METKKNSFEQGALILIVTGIISKTMGALYRIPLTNILGVEGIGMYQIVLSFLLLALALRQSLGPFLNIPLLAPRLLLLILNLECLTLHLLMQGLNLNR